MKTITLNQGAQRDFVRNEARLSAYIGGLGSGKTFAGIVRGLQFAQQPKPAGALYGARGLIGAINYPVLKDVILPQLRQIVEGSGLITTWDEAYVRSEKKLTLRNGAEILLRSLDDPDVIRGVELSWFFIDEGRHLTRYAFDVANGRLRQPGFQHAGWVCSTPNGFDWMWDTFHPDSPNAYDEAEWFNAPVHDNRKHVGEAYIRSLEATYSGKFYEQEVLGKFVGIVSGAVFPHWDSEQYLLPLEYDPDLPLYTMWDFGIGDPGVCLFAQLDWQSIDEFELPVLKFIDYIEAQDWTSQDWADAWRAWLADNADGRRPEANLGDPAGRQRQSITGTSVIDDLASKGVPIRPAPKRPLDYGIRILDNMMAGGRVLVSHERCSRLASALATHKWPTDDNGQRTGARPVHDWTSHFADAARYGAMGLLTHYPKRRREQQIESAPEGTMGDLMRQLRAPQGQWLGQPKQRPLQWTPPTIRAK